MEEQVCYVPVQTIVMVFVCGCKHHVFFQIDYVSGWISKVHFQSFWMMAYGAETPKRLICKSNWLRITELDCGRLARRYMQEKTQYQSASILMATLPEAYFNKWVQQKK